MAERWSGVERVAAAELDIRGVGVRSDPSWVMTNHRSAFINFL